MIYEENFHFSKSCCEIFGFDVRVIRVISTIFPYEPLLHLALECKIYIAIKPNIIQQFLLKKCSSQNIFLFQIVFKHLIFSINSGRLSVNYLPLLPTPLG